ncbi:MAG: type I-E CRISPR-associated protein Cas6/Cse3/CasE [Candidatus Zixiibacteriota bacterium]
MYLSCLLIDVGPDPDRPRPGRLWLRNLYRVHQRLCMAFPSASRISDDPDFLKPFKPEDFGRNQVHVARGSDAGFLFRVDPQPGGRVVILVHSAVKPDWGYAFRNASYLLAAAPEVKLFDPCFTKGEHLRFRLVANPTKRLSSDSHEKDGQPVAERWVGKRVPVREEELYEWLAGRGEQGGFSINKDPMTVQQGYIYFKDPQKKGPKGRLRSVRYDGVLKITDPARFQETLVKGIGPGKAFGFGLLSVAPSRASLASEAT